MRTALLTLPFGPVPVKSSHAHAARPRSLARTRMLPVAVQSQPLPVSRGVVLFFPAGRVPRARIDTPGTHT